MLESASFLNPARPVTEEEQLRCKTRCVLLWTVTRIHHMDRIFIKTKSLWRLSSNWTNPEQKACLEGQSLLWTALRTGRRECEPTEFFQPTLVVARWQSGPAASQFRAHAMTILTLRLQTLTAHCSESVMKLAKEPKLLRHFYSRKNCWKNGRCTTTLCKEI